MDDVAQKLDAVLYDADGEPVDVTRIETEILGRQFRWTIWSGTRRLFTLTGGPADVAEMLYCTELLTRANLADAEEN